MATWGEILKQDADAAGLPRRTLEQVTDALSQAKKYGSDKRIARMMLEHGRLTDEARSYVAKSYPQD